MSWALGGFDVGFLSFPWWPEQIRGWLLASWVPNIGSNGHFNIFNIKFDKLLWRYIMPVMIFFRIIAIKIRRFTSSFYYDKIY